MAAININNNNFLSEVMNSEKKALLGSRQLAPDGEMVLKFHGAASFPAISISIPRWAVNKKEHWKTESLHYGGGSVSLNFGGLVENK